MVFGNELLSPLAHGQAFIWAGSHEFYQPVGDLFRLARGDTDSRVCLFYRVVDCTAGKENGPTGSEIVKELVGAESEFVEFHARSAVDERVVTREDTRHFGFRHLPLEGEVGKIELFGYPLKTLVIRATALNDDFDGL